MPQSGGVELWLRRHVVKWVPEPILNEVRAYRRADAFRQAGVVMIHVPRAAGTSLSSELYGRFIGHFSVSELLAVAPADVAALPRFAVVRNPWDRLVSAWSFARRGFSLVEPAGASSPDTAARIRIRREEQYQIPEFDSFARFVSEWLAPRDVHRLDGVFRPQIDYVRDPAGAMPLEFLGRFEQLDKTAVWLSQVTGRQFDLPRLNASERGAYRSHYSPELARLVGEIYAKDIAAFGYEF
jgi:hypothetical protein